MCEVFKRARGDFISFTDADMSLPVTEFLKFIKALEVSDLAIGCRYWRGRLSHPVCHSIDCY